MRFKNFVVAYRPLRTKLFKPGMAIGTLRLEPEFVDPKDPPGDPIPPPQI
ncbi:MAG: hypothetical protein JRH01_17395 [Deltaproteobacteria bacterium]|nr:hypothetical protein [Deltaproteobacteria bacterium]MBW2396815.1 hypothetical protein [Deltaproteobacteria bacterium]